MDLARAPRRARLTARKKGSGYENGSGAVFYILSISRSAPSLFGRLSLCLHLEVSRDPEKIYRKKNCKMVNFCTMDGKKASFLNFGWTRASVCSEVCSLCVKTAFNLNFGRITV